MDIRRILLDLIVVILVLFIQNASSSSEFEDDDDDTPSWGRCPWIRNKLKNGRVKIRSRGRIAKFLCDPGYELAGKRFATCVRGQWNNPIPVCVSRGCSKISDVANGRVTEMYRGALLVYDCLPGYTLDGDVSIYCDGRRWSTPPPTCVVANLYPKTSCDFEDPDLCGWSHDPSHDFDWKRNQFATPSGHVGTGPSFDHTFGTGKGGFYLYEEASSPRRVNDTSRLFSPVYGREFSGGCFVFWYHMYGATTGGLRVYVKPESHVFGELLPKWEKFGDQGNQWLRGNVTVPLLPENFQIVIEGIRGTSYVGDTAIDDVLLSTSDCESIENSTESIAEPVKDSCRGRCRELEDPSACGCNDNCIWKGDCCSDYTTMCTAGNGTSDNENPEEYLTTKHRDVLTFTAIAQTEPLITTLRHSEDDYTRGASTDIPEPSTGIVTVTANTTTSTTQPSTLVSTVPTTLSSPATTLPSTTTAETTTTSVSSSVPLKSLTTSKSLITSPSSDEVSSTLLQENSTFQQLMTTPSVFIQESSTASATLISPTYFTTERTQGSTAEPQTRKTYNLRPRTQSTTPSSSPLAITNFSTVPATTISEMTPSSFEASILNRPSSSTVMTSKSASTAKTNEIDTTRQTISEFVPSTLALVPSTPLSQSSQFTDNTLSNEMQGTSATNAVTVTIPDSTTSMPFQSSTRQRIRIFTWKQPTTTSTKSSHLPAQPTTASIRLLFKSSTTTSTSTASTTISRPTSLPQTKLPKPTEVTTLDSHAAKSASVASHKSQPTVTITFVTLFIVVCAVGGLIYYMKRQKSVKQSKLSDESEMRFLSDNEIIEYSDSSVLDKILVE